MLVRFVFDEAMAGRIYRASNARVAPGVLSHVAWAAASFLVSGGAFWHILKFKTDWPALAGSASMGLLFATIGYFYSLSMPNKLGTEQARERFKRRTPCETAVSLTPECLHIEEAEIRYQVPWRSVAHVEKSDDWVVFNCEDLGLVFVPREAFLAEALVEAFVAKARALLAAAAHAQQHGNLSAA